MAGVTIGSYTGFDAHSWTDPVIVGDVNQNGSLDGLDSSWISRKGLSAAIQPEIPNLLLPAVSPFRLGIDPTILADSMVSGPRGGDS